MARLASDSKMGFYPTNIKTIKKIIDKTIQFPTDSTVSALDACAGEGEAIEFIGKQYNCSTYSVELDEKRAKVASKKEIDVVLNADAINGTRKSNTWAALNFLNPPYGLDNMGKRLELAFVERWGLCTAISGVLILVINPGSANEDMAKELRNQGYKAIASFYDEDNSDYQKFGQFFIVLEKRIPSFRSNINSFISLFQNPININDDFEFEKILIKKGGKPSLFKEIEIPRWKIEKKLEKSNLWKHFIQELTTASLSNSSIEHPNEGQAAQLIASGALNKKQTLHDGTEIILKGTTFKEKLSSEQSDNKTGEITAVKLIDHYRTVVYGLSLTHGQYIKFA